MAALSRANTLTERSNTLRGTRTGASNPFVAIPLQWRMLLVTYLLVYIVLTPGLREIVANSSAPLSGPRLVADMVYQLLVFAPIVFYRPRFGWLHPLIFPTVFGIGKHLIKSPGALLAPFAIGSAPQEVLVNPELPDFTARQMAWANLEHQLLSILGLLCYYGGFFFAQRYTTFDFKPSRVKFSRARRLTLILGTAVLVSVGVVAIYVQQHGGLRSYMLSYFGPGRFRARGEVGGSIFFMVTLGVMATLVWYALSEKATRNPLFWAAAAYAIPVNFFITGSRGAVFVTVALFGIVWVIRHRKIPKARVLAFGFLVLVLLGVMGDFRRSAWDGRMDWRVFVETGLSDAIEETSTEIDKRQSIQGGAGVMARVPEEVGFLKGKTYAGAVFFFVPKFIWESKPRGGGGLNGEIILGRGEGGGGVPIGPVAEAYWNFHIPGVVLVFFLFGIFHKALARTFRRHSHATAVWVLYVIVLVTLSPEARNMNGSFKKLTLALILLFAVGALSWRRRASS